MIDWAVLSPTTIEALAARALLYLPRLGLCALLLFVFWLGSRFVRRIVTGVAATAGLIKA